jgi:4-azaleucine resistance transporter AzlC
MHHRSTSHLKTAFLVSVPVLLGYAAIGIAFGLIVAGTGYPWWVTLLMSSLMYAGAGQYIGIGMLTAGAGYLQLAFITLLVNARHMVYGLSLFERFDKAGPYKPYLIFALTDETYALLTTVSPPDKQQEHRFYFLVALLNHSYWICACMLGYFAGKFIPLNTQGMGFALTALFIVLSIEQYKRCKRKVVFLIAIASGVGALILFGPDNMLIISITVAVTILMLLHRRL